MKEKVIRNTFIGVCFNLFIFSNVSCQKNNEDIQIEWLKNNATMVKTIDSEKEDFADLQMLKKIIGDSVKILMLGEQTHNDGSTISAKIRLIKFLHSEMGYDVIAFESSMYDSWKAQQKIAQKKEISSVIKKGINPIWSNTIQFEPLIDYITINNYSDTPLFIAGIDCQYTGSYSYEELIADLQILTNYIKDSTFSNEDINLLFNVIQSSFNHLYKPNQNTKEQFDFIVEKLIKKITEDTLKCYNANIDCSFWVQELRNIKGQINYMYNNDFSHFSTGDQYAYLRDKQMAENLSWLINDYYKGKKIIVWAANYHCIRNPQLLEYKDSDFRFGSNTRMGDFLYKEFGDKMFFLSFTSYIAKTNHIQAIQSIEIGIPSKGSFEDLFNKAGFEFAIIGLRSIDTNNSWMRNQMFMKESSYLEFKSDWTKNLDGIFFIKEMEFSDFIGNKY